MSNEPHGGTPQNQPGTEDPHLPPAPVHHPQVPTSPAESANPQPGALPPGGFGQSPPGYQEGQQQVEASAAPGWYTMPDGGTAWWDGAQWLPSPPQAPVAPYEPVTTLGGVVVGLLVLAGALSALTAVLEGWRYTMVQELQTDWSFSGFQRLEDTDSLVALADLAYLLSFVACLVVFLVWLHRVFKNLNGPLRSGPTRHTPGWAVGWWFVPFANYVKPKHVMNEAWCASEPVGLAGVMHWTHLKAPTLLSWWWATYLIGGLVSGIFIRFDDGQSIGVLKSQLLLSAIGSALLAISAVLAVQMVRQITARNTLRAVNLGLPVR